MSISVLWALLPPGLIAIREASAIEILSRTEQFGVSRRPVLVPSALTRNTMLCAIEMLDHPVEHLHHLCAVIICSGANSKAMCQGDDKLSGRASPRCMRLYLETS